MKLLVMPSGNLVNPTHIHGVIKFKGKGVALRNEYNKIICFEEEPDNARQNVIASELEIVVNAKKDAAQPDWKAAFSKLA